MIKTTVMLVFIKLILKKSQLNAMHMRSTVHLGSPVAVPQSELIAIKDSEFL